MTPLYRQVERYLIWIALIVVALHSWVGQHQLNHLNAADQAFKTEIVRVRNHINSLEETDKGLAHITTICDQKIKHFEEELHDLKYRIGAMEKRHAKLDELGVIKRIPK